MASYDPDCECVDCKMQRMKEKQKEINMQREKKKMTRKEAIACLQKHVMPIHNADQLIDFYIEAGMLEIVEEEQKPLILGYQFDHVKHELECAGYKVIKDT